MRLRGHKFDMLALESSLPFFFLSQRTGSSASKLCQYLLQHIESDYFSPPNCCCSGPRHSHLSPRQQQETAKSSPCSHLHLSLVCSQFDHQSNHYKYEVGLSIPMLKTQLPCNYSKSPNPMISIGHHRAWSPCYLSDHSSTLVYPLCSF